MELNGKPSLRSVKPDRLPGILFRKGKGLGKHPGIMNKNWLVILLIAGALTACAGVEHLPEEITLTIPQDSPALSFESDLFGEAPEIIDVDDIYLLTETQQKDFLVYFDHPSMRNIPEHQRVFDYLETITMNFGYHGETYSAQEALSNSSGNCLSLAILTTALA